MARRGKEMNKDQDEEGAVHQPWGTLEELLLACAVSRHGVKSWDSIAMELQKRASGSDHLRAAVYSIPNCKRRYHDLRSRFSDVDGDDDAAMVDELKKLRVAELRREVERRDVSIELLELKVKRLEEERERRKEELKEEEETDLPDEPENRVPEENSRRERSVSGGDNLSFNESNSTSTKKGENRVQNGDKQRLKHKPDNKPESADPSPVRTESKPGRKCSLTTTEERRKPNNSEAQSPRKKKQRRRSSSGEDDAEDTKLVHAQQIVIKSQPLIKILTMLRSHKNGSLFERRLRSQESEKYKKMIRQHMDLQTVQSRMDRGFYLNNNSHRKFFCDLLLLFTNAVIFFPPTSSHHIAAIELRQLVTKQMPKPTTISSPPKPDTDQKRPESVQPKPEKSVAKLRQPGNNPVPQKSDPGKKQLVSLPARASKVGTKLERPEAKPQSNRVSAGNKGVEDKSTKKQLVKERPELTRRSGRSGSGHSEKQKQKQKSPPKEVEEDSSDEDDGGRETEKEKKTRGERDRNNGRGKRGRPLRNSPVGRDVGRGKRRREGGDPRPPPPADSVRPRKRSKR